MVLCESYCWIHIIIKTIEDNVVFTFVLAHYFQHAIKWSVINKKVTQILITGIHVELLVVRVKAGIRDLNYNWIYFGTLIWKVDLNLGENNTSQKSIENWSESW
jgi:hypothetical protein